MYLIIAAIGPKISSLATRIDSFTSEITAGSTKKPDSLPFFSLPPVSNQRTFMKGEKIDTGEEFVFSYQLKSLLLALLHQK